MLGLRTSVRSKIQDQPEKPFWISFSDLMTSLMVLFLITMTVALMTITGGISARESAESRREAEISELLNSIQQSAAKLPGVVVRGSTIDFGDRARFESNSHRLSGAQESLLRSFVPSVLRIARTDQGRRWLKRIVVEGFADRRGTYMHNLNLSLQRSERVLCALMAGPEKVPDGMQDADRLSVRELFLVGGSSFNSLKSSLEESRRIELRLEFYELGEKHLQVPEQPLDSGLDCPLDR